MNGIGGYRGEFDPDLRRNSPYAKKEIAEELNRQGLGRSDLSEIMDRLPPRLCEMIHSVQGEEIILFGEETVEFKRGKWK